MSTVLPNDAHASQPLFHGPAVVQHSSRDLPWRGFLVEEHSVPAGERAPAVSTHHVMAILRGGAARGVMFPEGSRPYSYSKQPGSVTLIPAGPTARVVSRESTRLLVCAFERETVEQIANDLDRPITELRFKAVARDRAITQLSGLLEGEAASGGVNGTLYAESLAHALATRFLLLCSEDAQFQTAVRRSAGRLSRRSLQQVLDAMRADMANPPDLRTLAAICGYTRHHFLRIFRAATGLTPHQYLLALRIERAQELLRHSHLSLIEVAAQTGFSSQAHMTAVFRQHTNVTPGMWRRAQRAQFSVISSHS